MVLKPATMSVIGKARRRSSLIHPFGAKSPRKPTVRRTNPQVPQLGTPLPSSTTVGRATTIGIRGCPTLNKKATPVNVTQTSSRTFTPRATTVSRQSEVPGGRIRRPTGAPPVSKPYSTSSVSRSATRPVPACQPSESAMLKAKLADVEQHMKEKESQMQMQEQMIAMLKENLEMVKTQAQKVTKERDDITMERDLNKEMVFALKNELEAVKISNRTLVGQVDEKEVILRKLHNDVVDLRGQIRVVIRVRPMLKSEEATSTGGSIEYPAVNVISILQGSKPSGRFEFEKVFTPIFTQMEVFLNIEDFIMSALHGYNVGLIAFGQTGSGKTHTMRGGDAEQKGVIPRAGAFLFNESKKMESTGWAFEFSLSFLEIYNNEAYDLLNNHQIVKLQLGSQDVSMKGLSNHPIVKLSDMEELLHRADKNRKTAATKCNEYSSRSHAIYMWHIKAHQPSTGISTTSVLKLVDLAGSERAKESGATGQQFTEMTAINQSLSVLQKCVSLQKAKAKHVPYREAKLTQVLMDCLGRGNSKTMVIVNINPCSEQAQESKRSIEFASKMRDTHIGSAVQRRDL